VAQAENVGARGAMERAAARAETYGIAPGTPIGGCDPPQPTSNAAETPTRNA
jgi:hypothetical protein